MLDSSLAQLYGVPTKSLNLAVKRNAARFPEDFMFRLTAEETDQLRFQIETSKTGRGGRRYFPFVFTQEGIAMLSGVLHSDRAIAVNIAIMRAFVKLREWLSNNKELATQLNALESQVGIHDAQIVAIFKTIRRLMKEKKKPKKSIGFHVKYD